MSDPSSTLAVQLAALQAELVTLKAAITSAIGGMASFSIDGVSQSNWKIEELRTERTRLEKSIQRLLAGGRGIVIDMSASDTNETAVDPYGINGGM